MAMRYESVATMRMNPSMWANSTPVSSGRPSSWEAARTTWRTASPSDDSERWVVGSLVLPTGGNSTTGYVWSRNVERAAEIVTWSPSSSSVTAPGSSRRTMSVDRAGRNDTTAVVDADHLVGHRDGEVEVGAGDAQRVAAARQQQAEEHRGGAASPTHGAAGGGQHVDECVALGSELHGRRSFRERALLVISRGKGTWER